MKAIILAAGRGSRMKNLTDERPKCLVKLRGKPLLEWQLSALREAGISEIALVTGYKKEMLKDYGLVELNNPLWAETQMVTSLSCANKWLESEPCIVSYSDIFYDSSAVISLIESTADIAVTYDPNWLDLWKSRFDDPLSDAETFRLNPDGTLAEIGKKPKSLQEVQGQYMGLLRFTPTGWGKLVELRRHLTAEQKDKMHMTGALQLLIESEQISISGLPYLKPWGEVDSEADLANYED